MAYTLQTAQTSPGVQSFWDMTQPQNAYSTIQNGMDAGYQFSNFNGMPTLTGDKYMGGLNRALDMYNSATGQSLTAQQYDQMINPSSSGARWAADGSQTGGADYANAGQVLGSDAPVVYGSGAVAGGSSGGGGMGGGRGPGGRRGDWWGGDGGGYNSNPYLGGIADDITRRSQEALGQSLNMIGGAAVGVGGLGGSRQGVAQGQAISGANDNLTGQLANLYGTDWTNSQNRDLQRYGIDQNYSLGMTNAANQRYGIDQNYNLGMTNANNNFTLGSNAQRDDFYNKQRGYDLTALGIGSDLYSNTLRTVAGNSGTSGGKDGGWDWQGALGGLMGGLQVGNNWWKG